MQSSQTSGLGQAREQRSDKFHLWLDEPVDWSLKVRRLRLSGWCVAKKDGPLLAIRARLAGQVFDGRFDRERPEVAEFVRLPDAPRCCGFTVDVEVPFGRKRLELQVATADRQWHKAFARNVTGPLRVSAAERKLWAQIDEAEAQWRYAWFFSRPQDWRKPVRTLHIAGWCVNQSGGSIHGVRTLVCNREFEGNYGIARPDLAAPFPYLPAAERSGFALCAELSPGVHSLAVQLKTHDGRWRQFFSSEVIGAPAGAPQDEVLTPEELSFEVPVPQPPRFRFWFDRPTDWTQPARHLHVSGWCVGASGEEVVELQARIRRKIFRANYGIVRPDVAATLDRGPAALRSGFSLDVVLPFGTSTFALEARSSGGRWEQVFTTRVRGSLFRTRGSNDHDPVGNYREWVRLYDRLSRSDVQHIEHRARELAHQPKISVLLPVFNSNAQWLRRALDSVREQLYPNWELCVVDDASTEPHVWRTLQSYARRDQRIKIHRRGTNGHISAASNDALALATGEFVAFLDHDDELARTALYFAALEINRTPGVQLIYSDEDKLDAQGRRTDPYFKPDWNPDLFTSQNYVSHLSVLATALVRSVGGFREGFEGSQDYDLLLRCTERIAPEQIRHIPHVLYHWRTTDQSTATLAAAKPYAHDAALRALQEHLQRLGLEAHAVPDYADYQRVVYPCPSAEPLVSLVMPTRDRVSLLRQCISSIIAKTDYPQFEIVVVNNESREPETLDYIQSLTRDPRLRVVDAPGEFNFSRLNNVGVSHARGRVIALLNNDLEVINPGWLAEMVSHAARPEVGAVGARLWYPDGKMQHGGVILGVGGVATHAHTGVRKEHGYFGRAHLVQNFSAVTGACMVLRRQVYEELGGLDEVNLAVAFNDVDFCLRARAAGLRVVWTPHAELIHHESASRGLEDTESKQRRFLAEVEYMQRKWSGLLEADPFYSPNLSIESQQQFKLAFPPRARKPWNVIPH